MFGLHCKIKLHLLTHNNTQYHEQTMQHFSSYIKGIPAKQKKVCVCGGGRGLLHDSGAEFYMHSAAAKPVRKVARYNTYMYIFINLLKTKCNLLYIRNQSVPRCKHFPTWLYKPIS
jgi:hypothetical protein